MVILVHQFCFGKVRILIFCAPQEGQPSSSSGKLRSQFIGMGFSSKLVDKVLQRHGILRHVDNFFAMCIVM
jgi:hypothetical protein